VTVTNVNGAPTTMSMTGGAPSSGVFGAAQACQGVTLAPGASCQLQYDFTPTTAGLATDNSIGTLNGQPFDTVLRGTGADPRFRISSTALDFGDVPVGTSVQLQVDFTNVGLAPVMGNITGGAAGAFGGAQNCQGVTLAVGASCQLFCQFTPSIVGPVTGSTTGHFNGQPFAFDFTGIGIGSAQTMDLGPATISLTSTAATSAGLLSASGFDATTVNVANVANVRMLVNGTIEVVPVSRGGVVTTSTRDWNGDGLVDRMFTFRTADLVAAGLTTSPGPTTLVLSDRLSSPSWRARDLALPTFVP